MTAGPGCTGFSASWCPNCGDCTCPHDEEGIRGPLDDPSCPLHRPGSEHYELEWEARQVEFALEKMNDEKSRRVLVTASGGKMTKDTIEKVRRFIEENVVEQPMSIMVDDINVNLSIAGPKDRPEPMTLEQLKGFYGEVETKAT